MGIDEPREELISMLTKEDGGMSSAEQRIVSIVGFGGLGKTTLAKAVHDKIKPQFNCTAFVSVSRDPDIIKIFKDMLYELDKNEYMDIHNAALGQQHLTDLVQEFLKNKRYVTSCVLVQIITALVHSMETSHDYYRHACFCQQ